MPKLSRRWLTALIIAVTAAVMITHYFPATSIGEAVERVELTQGDPRLQAMVSQYPEEGVRMYRLYGDTELFAQMLTMPGYNQVIPVMAKCFPHAGDPGGDELLAFMARVRQILKAVTGQVPTTEGQSWLEAIRSYAHAARSLTLPPPSPLSSEECGWMVLQLAVANPNGFLRQFVIGPDGVARRLPGSTATALLSDLFTSGLRTVERRLVLGQQPSRGEWLRAGADILSIVAVTKVATARLAHAAIAKTKLAATITRASTATASNLTRFTAKAALTAGGVYVLIRHPQVATSLLAAAGEALGLGPWWVQVGGLTIFLLGIYLLWRVVRHPIQTIRSLGHGVHWIATRTGVAK